MTDSKIKSSNMKYLTILFILFTAFMIPVKGKQPDSFLEKEMMLDTTTVLENSDCSYSETDIVDKIIKEGGEMIYSVRFDSTMFSVNDNGNTVWPERYSMSSSSIYHYYMNGSLCFKIHIHKMHDSEKNKIITLLVTDIDCTGNEIFSCTYLCQDIDTSEITGIASELSSNQLLVLVNNVTENNSIAFKSEPENILRY